MYTMKDLVNSAYRLFEKICEFGGTLLPGTEEAILRGAVVTIIDLRDRHAELQKRVIELEEMVIRLSDSVADMSQSEDILN